MHNMKFTKMCVNKFRQLFEFLNIQMYGSVQRLAALPAPRPSAGSMTQGVY